MKIAKSRTQRCPFAEVFVGVFVQSAELFFEANFPGYFFLLLKKSDLAIIKISSHISSIDLEWQKLEPGESSSPSSSSSCDKNKNGPNEVDAFGKS